MNKQPPIAESDTSPSFRSILVTGDVVRDIYIYQGDRIYPAQKGEIAPYFSDLPGGARGLFELIYKAQPSTTKWGLRVPRSLKGLRAVHVLWTACKGGTRKEDDEATKVWRVGQPLGYALSVAQTSALPRSNQAEERHAVIVMDDAGLAFRTQPAAGSWPPGILGGDEEPEWIIHKMANPIAQGDLWRTLISDRTPSRRARLIVIVSADELRRAGAAISRGFSWERTLSELCAELNHNPRFQPLLRFSGRLIVNFGCVGAVWFGGSDDRKDPDGAAQNRATLVYDPTLPEGGWKTRLTDNHDVYGHLNTFTAAIALAAAGTQGSAPPDLDSAIERGLAACRQLRLLGHGAVSSAKPGPPLAKLVPLLSANPAKPAAVEATLKKLIPDGFQVIPGPCRKVDPAHTATWTLTALAENPPDHQQLPLYGLAHRTALYGLTALHHIPHAHFGTMLSVDRQEIETLRGLKQLIQRYEKEKQPRRPLSITAFGPPGAGKSFGIIEISREVLGSDVPILLFNLSQFDSPSELFGAFHQVRDQVLKGVIPIVFWDEFDSHDYQWLQYLLAPMQDGTFEEHGHTHTIGKCLFVFAGATSWDFEHFGPAPMPEGWQPSFLKQGQGSDSGTPANPNAKPGDSVAQLVNIYNQNKERIQADQDANDGFRRKKGPDFLSRLDGHIDVLGPNPRLCYDWATRTWIIPDPDDITFPVRRALLLRQFLGARKPEDTLDIDRDLLRAFLQVPRYRHGARSLEKIARHLAHSHPPFRRAELPPSQVLAQHLVSDDRFIEIYEGNRSFLAPDNLRRIAAAIADFYDRKYTGADDQTADEALTAFAKKTPWAQATNLAAAQRLPSILAIVGLRLEEGKADPKQSDQVSAHIDRHLEVLAEEEHRLWMGFHFDNGWRQVDDQKLADLKKRKAADKTAYDAEIKRLKDEERQHTLLIPFKDLSDEDKAKDHDAIRNFPGMADLVGWRISFFEH